MPTLSVGTINKRGVTLVEMLVVVAIISIMIGVSFPAINSGIDSLRLNSAASSIVSFMNAGLNRAARRQDPVEVTISKADNALSMRSTEASFSRELNMPEGVRIVKVLPELQVEDEGPRTFMLYPGGTVPRFGVQIENRRRVERIVSVDPITGVPRIERPTP
jgi:prepilin-type N-terminal cleavage/methylation domain-containing protein